MKHDLKLRMPDAHEELLSIFLNRPKRFKEVRHALNRDMFQEYAGYFDIMTKLDADLETWTYTDFLRLNNPDSWESLDQIRGIFLSEHVIDELIPKAKKKLLDQRLRELGKYVVESEEDADERLRRLQEASQSLYTTEANTEIEADQTVDAWFNRLKEKKEDPSKAFGLLTGIKELDGITKGLRKEDLIVVGARTSMGKSAFTIELLLRLAVKGYKPALFSLEMSKDQVRERMAANICQIAFEKVQTGQLSDYEIGLIESKLEIMDRVYIDDTRGVSADYIVDQMRFLQRERGLDCVIVDYLQDVAEKGESNDNTGSALSRICRKLRMGASRKRANVPVIALSQVTRNVDQRDDKRPTVSDLSGSTGIETSADMIIMLYRDDYYNEKSEKRNIMEINVAKNRNGKLGKVELYYDRIKQKIYSLLGGEVKQ